MKERQTGPESLSDPIAEIHFDALDFEVWPALKTMAISSFGVFHLKYF